MGQLQPVLRLNLELQVRYVRTQLRKVLEAALVQHRSVPVRGPVQCLRSLNTGGPSLVAGRAATLKLYSNRAICTNFHFCTAPFTDAPTKGVSLTFVWTF